FALYEVEDLESRRSGQRVIDEHDVRAKGRQGRDEGTLTLNASRVHAESAAPQAVQHQLIIRCIVLGDQDTKLGILHYCVWSTSPRVPSNSLLLRELVLRTIALRVVVILEQLRRGESGQPVGIVLAQRGDGKPHGERAAVFLLIL